MKIRYVVADDVCKAVRIITKLDVFSHIDVDRIHCVRSYGARTRALARIYGTPLAWRAVGKEPEYLIEVIAEHFYPLSAVKKVEVLVHELLHIPRTFSGALRPHGRYVNDEIVSRITDDLVTAGLIHDACNIWRS